ncbi:MAG: hypothetical protein HYW25_06200 [Candidatus Aenigmarchaeota archaeon]|nr:hypothetical protein [Candidatus Aenigmarchaeota archaeon]
MGYVFTPREFEDGKIPTPEDYRKATRMLRDSLKDLSDKGVIHGANINGSSLHENGVVGSDVDVLILTNVDNAEDELRRLRRDVREETYVPLDLITIPMWMAQTGNHDVGRLYATYLQEFCRDGIVGNDPIVALTPNEDWESPPGEVLKRFKSQLLRLSKQRANVREEFDEDHCKLLERLMRQPIYAAIDMLRLRGKNRYPSRKGKPLSKEECLILYECEFPELSRDCKGDLVKITRLRHRYREFLSIREAKIPRQYVELLRMVDSAYPSATRVIAMNLDYLHSNFSSFHQE